METLPVIKAENLSKVYQPDTVPVHAVNHVDLTVDKGEFTALVGPSGSGKTTVLNLLGGLDAPSSGRVWINGTDITALRPDALIRFRLHHIGFVFQSYNLIPVLSAEENIEFIMLLQKRPAEERKRRAMELLTAIGMTDKVHVRPNRLSGGQQQRVAVARALASKPEIILADEPTANLDSHSASNLLEIMERMNHEENVTFLFSTHDQRVIDRAHRVITLVDGRIASDVRTGK